MLEIIIKDGGILKGVTIPKRVTVVIKGIARIEDIKIG